MVTKRPGVDKFLEKVSEIYDLYVFSNGVRDYVNDVCSILDPENKYFSPERKFSRQNPESIKNFSKMGLLDGDTVILDDNITNWLKECDESNKNFAFLYSKYFFARSFSEKLKKSQMVYGLDYMGPQN